MVLLEALAAFGAAWTFVLVIAVASWTVERLAAAGAQRRWAWVKRLFVWPKFLTPSRDRDYRCGRYLRPERRLG